MNSIELQPMTGKIPICVIRPTNDAVAVKLRAAREKQELCCSGDSKSDRICTKNPTFQWLEHFKYEDGRRGRRAEDGSKHQLSNGEIVAFSLFFF